MEVDSDCCEERMETDEENDEDNILKGEMLGDRDIMKAQSLLKIQFPGIDGLLPPTLGPAGQFPPIPNGFVQIINTMELHWVCHTQRPDQAVWEISITTAWSALGKPVIIVVNFHQFSAHSSSRKKCEIINVKWFKRRPTGDYFYCVFWSV